MSSPRSVNDIDAQYSLLHVAKFGERPKRMFKVVGYVRHVVSPRFMRVADSPRIPLHVVVELCQNIRPSMDAMAFWAAACMRFERTMGQEHHATITLHRMRLYIASLRGHPDHARMAYRYALLAGVHRFDNAIDQPNAGMGVDPLPRWLTMPLLEELKNTLGVDPGTLNLAPPSIEMMAEVTKEMAHKRSAR